MDDWDVIDTGLGLVRLPDDATPAERSIRWQRRAEKLLGRVKTLAEEKIQRQRSRGLSMADPPLLLRVVRLATDKGDEDGSHD